MQTGILNTLQQPSFLCLFKQLHSGGELLFTSHIPSSRSPGAKNGFIPSQLQLDIRKEDIHLQWVSEASFGGFTSVCVSPPFDFCYIGTDRGNVEIKKVIRPSWTAIVLFSRTTEQHSLSMDVRLCTCDVGCLGWGSYRMEERTLEIEQSTCRSFHLQSGSGRYQGHFVCGSPYGEVSTGDISHINFSV